MAPFPLLLASLAAAAAAADIVAWSQKELEAQKECNEKFPLGEEDAKSLATYEPSPQSLLNVGCIYQKLGFMSADGEFRAETYRQFCTAQCAAGDPCELELAMYGACADRVSTAGKDGCAKALHICELAYVRAADKKVRQEKCAEMYPPTDQEVEDYNNGVLTHAAECQFGCSCQLLGLVRNDSLVAELALGHCRADGGEVAACSRCMRAASAERGHCHIGGAYLRCWAGRAQEQQKQQQQ